MTDLRRRDAVLGALVADAASLGLHWLYDVDRIASVVGDGSSAFMPIDPQYFEGVAGYFAHSQRADGASSQYGECLWLALDTIADGRFDAAAYQAAFAAHFGPGGTYTGYIDRPTRGTLDNIANEMMPTGIDDDQLPAITRLPAVVAYCAPKDILPAIEVTNVNAVASQYGTVFATLLQAVIDGTALADALGAASEGHADLQAALTASEQDSVAYGETTGRACHLPMAMPLVFHILARVTDYSDAVERNIRAGGDSCGRAIMIGSVMGAAYGVEGRGMPLHWVLRTKRAQAALS